jgi:hypothetical protein
MSEFLGNDWHADIEQWGLHDVCVMPDNAERCDTLWAAVKDKLSVRIR